MWKFLHGLLFGFSRFFRACSQNSPNPPTPVLGARITHGEGGAWELVYTDTQPFRCSPFFMALGEVFGEEKGQAETLFSLHRAATSNGEIGRVRQTISEATLVREECWAGLDSGRVKSETGWRMGVI